VSNGPCNALRNALVTHVVTPTPTRPDPYNYLWLMLLSGFCSFVYAFVADVANKMQTVSGSRFA